MLQAGSGKSEVSIVDGNRALLIFDMTQMVQHVKGSWPLYKMQT